MSETTKVELPLADIRAYCETQPIARLSLFGSDFAAYIRPDCDIAMLIEYAPNARLSYFDLAGHEIDLGEILGHNVDLRTPAEVRRLIDLDKDNGMRLVYAQSQSN